MTEEFCYLLERSAEGKPEYLMVEGNTSYPYMPASFGWTDNPHHALRFSRYNDALLFAAALLFLSENLPVRNALNGFRRGDDMPLPVEHGFMSDISKVGSENNT